MLSFPNALPPETRPALPEAAGDAPLLPESAGGFALELLTAGRAPDPAAAGGRILPLAGNALPAGPTPGDTLAAADIDLPEPTPPDGNPPAPVGPAVSAVAAAGAATLPEVNLSDADGVPQDAVPPAVASVAADPALERMLPQAAPPAAPVTAAVRRAAVVDDLPRRAAATLPAAVPGSAATATARPPVAEQPAAPLPFATAALAAAAPARPADARPVPAGRPAMERATAVEPLRRDPEPVRTGAGAPANPGAAALPALAPATPAMPAPAPSPLPAPIAVPVGDAGFGDALGDRVLFMAASKLPSAEIRLNPAELGPVRVEIRMDDGGAQVTIQAQHAATRDALEQALPRLREMFANEGLTLSGSQVGEQGVREERDGDGRGPRLAADEESAEDDVEAADRAAGPSRAADGLVDTFA